MARTRRKTRWYDSLATGINVPSSAGGVYQTSSQDLISEAQMEDELSGATLIRVVGDFFATRSVGTAGVLVMALSLRNALVALANHPAATLRLAEDYEDFNIIWTKMWSDQGLSSNSETRIPVDIRTKRKVRQQQALTLGLNNTDLAVGTNNINLDWHLRFLFLLP